MSTKLYEQTKKLVFDRLSLISVANGYKTNPSILNGWLIFYVEDLIKGNNGLSFPAIAVQYNRDTNNQNQGSVDNKCTRLLTLMGAVSTDDPNVVNEKLDDLVFDIKCALGNTDRNLTLSQVRYMLPENNTGYACFEIDVGVIVNEKWEK